ncbi:probable peroxisomal acyl-coenzyme A oxidase 1 [Eurytemora carolleeae]|uniref:probable peroxisomal acyl-coenzyme A oxidase 1 n=1 Tax=Eurytemora carolleeae TaxID=1294199 RepID=UPI000C77A73E|nr:probable peroxisomal acyl-coenzyme A oxidase 1 [Eurytemora carolleeae]|eukprot:XP_023324157.1 probable peroxisomal acyl-coenzyme A oxidase 1 [Eurytemora affinis]
MSCSMFSKPPGVNPDLAEERTNLVFKQEELTYFLDGSKQLTEERRELENFFLNHKLFKERKVLVVETLSNEDRYNYELELACRLMIVAQEAEDAGHNHAIRGMFNAGLGAAYLPDGNPINLHFVMFLPTLMGQGTPDQISDVLGRAWNMDIVGTYAQTELGHGTFIRGLELQAEYHADSEEFELHSPSLTAFKWWPGGLGRTATHAVVMAQLTTQGKKRGVHPFLVQIRDEKTYKPFPGVLVGEIGPKLGMNANDNGYLGFVKYRIPLSALLSKNSQVEPDGSYISPPRAKLNYATMVFVRSAIALDITVQLRKALTIGTRNAGAVEQTRESERCSSTSIQLVQLPTQSNIPGVSMALLWLEILETPSIAGTKEQTMESEQCSSTSIQLVQLPTHSNIPGVPMVRNTGGSEDCWNYRMDNRIRAM